MGVARLLHSLVWLILGVVFAYILFLSVLTIPVFQNQVIYLNSFTLTWFQDLNVPEQWGFLHNQVTPFTISTPDGQSLHTWHILPLGTYQRYEDLLTNEPCGLVPDITTRLSYKLLRDDPNSLLVIYFHGAAGTLGSGWRPQSYRAISAGASDRIHIVAVDYRGFGASSGAPSENGLLIDALALAEWAMEEAEIPPSRIVLFGQSLGTAVSISLAHHLASRNDSTLFSGMVLVAPFADVESLTATYRVGGIIPILDPVVYIPTLLAFFNTFIISKWPSKDRLAEFVRLCEKSPTEKLSYDVTLIHAVDDYDVPWTHSDVLYWHAVNASTPMAISFAELEEEKTEQKKPMGAGGWSVERQTKNGIIREQILQHGLHDRIMSYPIQYVKPEPRARAIYKMTTPSYPPGGTFFDTIKRSFTKVTVDKSKDNAINTTEFLEAAESLTTLFDVLGSAAFKPVKSDMGGNIKKIRDRQLAAPLESESLQDLCANELKAKKHTASEGLLWLNRGLDFTAQSLRKNLTNSTEELSTSFRAAYSDTLKPYHSFVVKPIFSAAMSATPYRKDFYKKLGDDQEKVNAELGEWLSSLENIVSILKQFTTSKEFKW